MGNLDGMWFNRLVGNAEADAIRPERGSSTDRIVDPRTSPKRTYTLENNAVVPCKDGLFHHPV